MDTFPTILSCDWSTHPQRITTGPILSYTPSLCTHHRPRRRIEEPIRSPLTHPLAKYTCIPSLSMMFGKKSPSAHTQSIQYSSPSTIFFTRHQPTARRHRTTGDIPGTCVKLFDCWRLLNNESIPIPPRTLKNIQEYFYFSSHFLSFTYNNSPNIAPVGFCTYHPSFTSSLYGFEPSFLYRHHCSTLPHNIRTFYSTPLSKYSYSWSSYDFEPPIFGISMSKQVTRKKTCTIYLHYSSRITILGVPFSRHFLPTLSVSYIMPNLQHMRKNNIYIYSSRRTFRNHRPSLYSQRRKMGYSKCFSHRRRRRLRYRPSTISSKARKSSGGNPFSNVLKKFQSTSPTADITYKKGKRLKLTHIVVDGSNYKPSWSTGAGKITYTIFFSDDTHCNLIWTDGEWEDTLTADTKCTQEMKDAIAQYVEFPVLVETNITHTPSKWHEKIKLTIKRNLDYLQ